MNQSFSVSLGEPTRSLALERLGAFVPSAGEAYTRLRNTDFGPGKPSAVSGLSPFIRHRLITETEVLAAVLARHRYSDCEKFVCEVFWRFYFKGYLESRPEIWQAYQSARDRMIGALETDSGLASRYQTAIAGQTGIDCFDAWVNELIETGYLHNHARMWFASIWIFTLKLPWELGADFTFRHFLDGDTASNTLSWRWVGGLHTKGKTYLARAANIAEFTEGRFSPKGLAMEASPLTEAPMARVSPPQPVPRTLPREPALLLLTGEDLHPESLGCDNAEIGAIVGATIAEDRSSLALSPLVRGFSEGALEDALSRAQSHFKTTATPLPSFTADALIATAEHHGLKTILMPYAAIGPVRDRIDAITPALAEAGLDLVPIIRPEDHRIWPHAKKGFFDLKQHIPSILADLRITDRASIGSCP